jgi:capsid protein
MRLVRGRYDAAVTNAENRRHWANADGLSVNAANSPEVRRVLRNRARYEVANNSYARGIVLTLAHDVVGTGPRLQLLTTNADANNRIEHEFGRWTKAIGLAEKLRTMRLARAEDGEAFAVLASNPRLATHVSLDLKLIEADQVTTPDLNPLERNIDGVVFDEAGNPTEYHVLKQHPGDSRFGFATLPSDYERLPAESMIHWFRADWPGQARGIPDIMPSLPLFAQLRRFTLAVLAAAETAADFAGILYTDAPANVARADSSGYNYASGRLDYQTYFKAIRVEQSHLECVVLDRIFAAWLDEAALIPGLLPEGLPPIATWEHQWFWDGNEHVDPAKEASAQATRRTSHTTTLAEEYARRGLDWEEQLRQRAKEITLLKELGITAAAQPVAAPEGEPDDDPDAEPDDEPAEDETEVTDAA